MRCEREIPEFDAYRILAPNGFLLRGKIADEAVLISFLSLFLSLSFSYDIVENVKEEYFMNASLEENATE